MGKAQKQKDNILKKKQTFKITVALEGGGISEVVTADVHSPKILSNGKPDYLGILNDVTPHLNKGILEQIYKQPEDDDDGIEGPDEYDKHFKV